MFLDSFCFLSVCPADLGFYFIKSCTITQNRSFTDTHTRGVSLYSLKLNNLDWIHGHNPLQIAQDHRHRSCHHTV